MISLGEIIVFLLKKKITNQKFSEFEINKEKLLIGQVKYLSIMDLNI